MTGIVENAQRWLNSISSQVPVVFKGRSARLMLRAFENPILCYLFAFVKYFIKQIKAERHKQ